MKELVKRFKIKFKNKAFEIEDLADFGFLTEPRYYSYGWSRLKSCYARSTVVKRLFLAKKYLPEGYNFKIWDGYRTKKTQRLMRKSFRKRLEKLHPDWNSKRIIKALYKFAGPPVGKIKNTKLIRQAGHFLGEALDLTIVNGNGIELDMGTDFDDLTEKAALRYFDKKKSLSRREKIIKKNRRLLVRVMKKAEFKPYPDEWWHWSYFS